MLGHATGGIAALRYAMTNSDRLLSLITMDTSPETSPLPPEVFARQAGIIESAPRTDLYESTLTSHAGVFLQRLEEAVTREQAVAQVKDMFEANDPVLLGRFMRAFFVDPGQHIERLRLITCPMLSLVGEYDLPFIESAKLLAETVPGAKLQIIPGIGHMTPFEDLFMTVQVIRKFLDESNLRRSSRT